MMQYVRTQQPASWLAQTDRPTPVAGDPSGELVTVTLGGGKGLPALAVGACHNLGAAAAKIC